MFGLSSTSLGSSLLALPTARAGIYDMEVYPSTAWELSEVVSWVTWPNLGSWW